MPQILRDIPQNYHSFASSLIYFENGWHLMTPCLTPFSNFLNHSQLHLAAPRCTRSSRSSTSFEANCVERKCSRPWWQEMRAQFLRRMLLSMEQIFWDISFSDFQMTLENHILHPIKRCKMNLGTSGIIFSFERCNFLDICHK